MNRYKKIVFILLIISLCSQILTADQNITNGSDILKIGVIYNLNGSQASLDIPSYQGALTAEKIINKNGGINGILVDIVMRNGESDPSIIEKQAEDLIVNKSVPVIIGLSDTDMVLPGAKIAAKSEIPFITSGASSPKLPEEVPGYLYLACFGDNAQAAVSAEYAYQNLSLSSATVIYDADMQYTTLLAGYFIERFKELGGEIVDEIPLSTTNNLSYILTNLTVTDLPDLYYIALGPEDAPKAVRAIHRGEITTPIFGGDSYDTKNLSDAALSIDGDVYYTTHAYFGGNNLSPEVQTFLNEYRAEFGTSPTPFAGLGYDTVGLVINAAGYNRPGTSISEGINQITEYKGVTGTISYENKSAIPKKSVTLMLAGGKNLTHVGDLIPEKVPQP